MRAAHHSQKGRSSRRNAAVFVRPMMIAALALMMTTVGASVSFAADDKGFVPLRTAPIDATQGLNLNLSTGGMVLGNNGGAAIAAQNISLGTVPNLNINLGGTMSAPTGTGLFDQGSTAFSCQAGESRCLTGRTEQLDLGFSKRIAKTKPRGLDVELVPSAAVRFEPGEQSAAVGAMVRIGDDLRKGNVSSNTWYVFAGADAEALAYSPDGNVRGIQAEYGLQDRVIIGDAQAGVGYRIGDADVSLGYFRREVSGVSDTPGGTNISTTEDAAAISFTWKR